MGFIAGTSATSIANVADPRAWALEVLGFPVGTVKPTKKEVQTRFRDALRSVHPDHGGDESTASRSIDELGEARRILLG
jgi:curved DNA-binding protein CbpA